ncbi:MAG: helix-turn-helix transcriptional regulator [Gammaproteobacteria bacterium]|nr:helix-turn-helix transcriptional regulator [Gammaproteobacteria bacterium]
MHFRTNINPAVLKWARESAKLSVEQAAKKAGVKTERYMAWEDPDDEAKPTIRQLRTVSRAFHRPLSLFYLAEVPSGFQPMKDLRRLPSDGLLIYSPELAYEMELAQQRRELSIDLTTAIGEQVAPFALRASIDEDPEDVGRRIREALGIRFSDQVNWKRRGALEPFKAWRRAIEDLDVLVFQMSRVDSSEVCGFALAAEARPMIVVNRKDVPNRRTFSLLHELAHLLLGQSGASDLDVEALRPSETQAAEVFCNAAAAAALMPRERLLGIDVVQKHGTRSNAWRENDLRELARTFGVSREALLRRLLTLNRTTSTYYNDKAEQWKDEWEEEQKRYRKQLQDSDKEFIRNPPLDVFYELGRPFVRLVLDSMNANVMTLNEASGHFGNLRLRHFSKLEQHVYTG